MKSTAINSNGRYSTTSRQARCIPPYKNGCSLFNQFHDSRLIGAELLNNAPLDFFTHSTNQNQIRVIFQKEGVLRQLRFDKFRLRQGLLQVGDIPNGNPVLHGAGLFRVKTTVSDVNLLTIHLRPDPSDGTSVDGDNLRLYEITEIFDATLNSDACSGMSDLIVLGDFNAISRKDVHFHSLPDNGTRYQVHDYIADNTSLIDVIGTRYSHCFMYTTASSRRIDYVYMDEASYRKITDACVLTERWTAPQETSISNFRIPSDHRPILIDMQY